MPKLLDGEPEAHVIAMPLGQPSPGYGNWSLILLARQVAALGVVDSTSRETVGRTQEQTGSTGARRTIG